MPVIPQPIGNLIGGVSQQSPAVRNPDQCEEQINAWPSPVDGLSKRPPTQHIKRLVAGATANIKMHMVNRSESEQYALLFGSGAGNMSAFTMIDIPGSSKVAGDSLTITDDTAIGSTYLTYVGFPSATHFNSLKIQTISDYTFVLNTKKTVVFDTGTTTAAQPTNTEAYIFVRQGNYKTNYKIRLKVSGVDVTVNCSTWNGQNAGGTHSTPSTAASDLASIKTDDIAEELLLKINASTSFTATRKGSVIKITHGTLATAVEPMDSVGDSVLAVIWNEIPRVSGYLPEICTHGFIVKVVGTEEIFADDYFVKFVADEGSGAFGKGHWVEDLDYSQPYNFDASTMPHVLIRQFDTTGGTVGYVGPYFQWRRATWLPKITGDTTLNPAPSFVGKLLANMFHYKERFGLLADDRIVMSETREPFNFFRTTLLTVLDSDPIDVFNTHTPPALCKSATPYNQNIILKGERNQFMLRGDEILSQRTIQITPASNFECYDTLDPISAGRSLFFGFKRGDQSGIREFFQVGDSELYDSVDITAHVPNYIEGTITHFACSTLEDTLVVQTDDDLTKLYVYKYLWQGDQKILSSWGKWDFGVQRFVRYFMFVNNTLFLLVEYPDGLYLEKMELTAGLADTNADYITYLDRRIDEDDVTGLTYDPLTNETVFDMPYEMYSPMAVVNRDSGVRYTIGLTGATEITVQGNLTAENFFVGAVYTKTYTMTEPIAKRAAPSGRGLIPISGTKQVAKKLWLEYKNSGAFTVRVTCNGISYDYEVAGPTLDFNEDMVDNVELRTGSQEIPIHADAKTVQVQIINSGPYPSNITSAIWYIMVYNHAGNSL